MHLPDIALHEVDTLEEAAAVMRRHAPHARFLAGGTDLLVDLKAGRVSAGHIVSLNRLDALRGVSETGSGIRIGALTTISRLAASPIIRERFSPILDAAEQMAARQIRNVATVGGNIASAVPCADLPPILAVLDASVVLWSPAGERAVPLDDFFSGPRQTVRRRDEVITAIDVPAPAPGFGAAYARLGLREGNAIAVAGVAAGLRLDDDRIRRARVVLGAVAPIPKRAEAAEAALVSRAAGDEAFAAAAEAAMEAAEPICDVRGSADYRRRMVGVLTRRALETARGRIGHSA